ncbi:site-specific integrase [Psychroserpens sp.]|uniref:site-specific integrase n=1 Tax=Psychroserpens sp. TaxID=2020870 RepID=UPI001B28F7B7|nr:MULTISPECIES: site-specific integrase [Flavobacteriaceae]MBO6590405.1 site-specific integrase [Allomuricauda sp.]MBO6619954.1 site-specific integrase [Allomuricauda sp.]MBO6645926.1 site-specific integrase [Allomuricauda sp.]MBO6748292.1 site-specific integrase [Allomuricauda sp.]MBO6845232.1 site-specific integrase [Allomuricauda sp.]
MRTRSTFSISFWISTARRNDGTAKIYARITVDSQRVNMSLKYTIPIEIWGRKGSRVLGRTKEAQEINTYLMEVETELFQCYRELRSRTSHITPQMVKAHYFGEDINEFTLKNLFEYHNTHNAHSLCKATLSHYKTCQNYLLKYIQKQYKCDDYRLSQLNHQFIVGFETYLRKLYPINHHSNLSNNSAMKHIQRLRKMIRMAVDNEWIDRDPFQKFKIRMERKEREFLSLNELQKIQTYHTVIERLRIVKDLFVFSCYTGIAYSDIMNLNEDNLVLSIDGKHWISTKRQKTKNSFKLPLMGPALSIIKRYQYHPKRQPEKLFPKISNQKLNSYLKEIADACDITKNITFHVARHTFATTITLSNGVPIETVSKILGHTKLTTTQIYARVLDKKISEDMSGLESILESKLSDSIDDNEKFGNSVF